MFPCLPLLSTKTLIVLLSSGVSTFIRNILQSLSTVLGWKKRSKYIDEGNIFLFLRSFLPRFVCFDLIRFYLIMPFDSKRINGPETSFPYKQFIKQEENSKPVQLKKKRADGRRWDESRKLGWDSVIVWWIESNFDLFSNSVECHHKSKRILLSRERKYKSPLCCVRAPWDSKNQQICVGIQVESVFQPSLTYF